MKPIIHRLFIVAPLFAILPLFSACGPARPDDMPETAPCTITVLKDGAPLPDVEVSLYREKGNGALSIRGKTDANGIALIRSSWGEYSSRGAPIGKNKITIVKHFAVPGALTADEIEMLSPQEQMEYEKKYNEELEKNSPVPRELSQVSSTNLEIDIQAGNKATLVIDVNAR